MSLVMLDAATIRRVALVSDTDRRSVRAFAEGKHVRGRAGLRIRIALQALGFDPNLCAMGVAQNGSAPISQMEAPGPAHNGSYTSQASTQVG